MNPMNIVPKGWGTNVTILAGIVGAWAIFLLGGACVDPATVPEAAAAACGKLGTVQISLTDAVSITWGGIAGMFLRRAVAPPAA